MAAAAAASAAAAAAAANQSRLVESTGDKQFELLLKTVEPLKDSSYFNVRTSLERGAYAYGWPPHIMERNVARPPTAELTEKMLKDEKNAYLIILNKTDGHMVSSVLQGCAQGDAKGAFRMLHEFFHSNTTAGMGESVRAFHSATMGSTETNVVEWVAHVSRLARDVREAGGQADEQAELLVTLNGLLPEFDFIKKTLNAKDDITLSYARNKIINYAKEEKLEHITKNGTKPAKHNTYTVDVDTTTPFVRPPFTAEQLVKMKATPCRRWAARRCTRGPACKFSHKGPGACVDRQGNQVQEYSKVTAPAVHLGNSVCHYCNVDGHVMRSCPALAADNHQEAARVHLASTSKKVDYVFFHEGAPTEQAITTYHDLSSDDEDVSEITGAVSDLSKEVEPMAKPRSWTSIALNGFLVAFLTVFIFAPANTLSASAKFVTRSPYKIAMFVVLITIFLGLSQNVLADQVPQANIQASSFFGSSGALKAAFTPEDYEWCSDSGTNRFVTNDRNDFVGGTICDTPTIVAVGGGNVTSPCFGTVIIESLDHGCTLQCLDVLFMPACSKKLMPASPFIKKGCSLVLDDFDKIKLRSGTGTSILSGREFGGLYYYRCKTVHTDTARAPTAVLTATRNVTAPIRASELAQQKVAASSARLTNRTVAAPAPTNATVPVRASELAQQKVAASSAQQKVAASSARLTDRTTAASTPITAGSESNDSYFGLQVGKTTAAGVDFARQLLETHFSLGHLNFDSVRKLLRLGKGGNPACATCSEAKTHQGPLEVKPVKATHVNSKMHIDLGYTRNCSTVFQLYLDDYTSETWLDVLDSKADNLTAWIALKTHLENKNAPWKYAFIKTDGEPVYTSKAWDIHCVEEGIVHEISGHYRHDQNGRIERGMQAVGVSYRCMMIQGCCPDSDTPDCLRHANTIRNNSPTKANDGLTPREKAAGMKLPLNPRLMKGPFACLVFINVYEEQRPKHAQRGLAGVNMGYDEKSNTYKVKEWNSGKKYYTADLTWHPHVFPYRANPTRSPTWLQQYDVYAPHVMEGTAADVPSSVTPRRPLSARQHEYQYSAGQDLRAIPDNDAPPHNNSLQLVQASAGRVEPLDFDNFMVHAVGPDPKSMVEALSSKYRDQWIAAELVEKANFEHHQVFDVVPRAEAKGRKIFKPRPVLKIKMHPPSETDPYGSIDKFKYRLTIAAFTKMLTQGIDYKEKNASTVRFNSILILLALAVYHGWDIVLYDIRSFFLYGKFEGEEVFMEQQPGWEPEGKPREDFICKLNRTMYGHPAAAHYAQKQLKQALTANDLFKATTADDCVYVSQANATSAATVPQDRRQQHAQEEGYAAMGAHVDDLCAIGDAQGLQKIKDVLGKAFNFTEVRNPDVITGIQVDRNRAARSLKLHQTAYTTELLQKYDMLDCRSVDTPVDPGTARALMLLPTTPADPTALKEYQVLMGLLIWLKCRPDMSFAINLFSRFLSCATRQHLDLLRGRPLRYLKGTLSYGLMFQAGDGEWKLSGASDSDLAGDLTTARSTSGYYTKLGLYGVIVASSKLERKVSTSTGQAETYAMVSLVKEVVWERHLLQELRHGQAEPTAVACDNDGVLKQSTKTLNHSMAKHYRIGQAYIRNNAENKTVKVVGIDTTDNPSDIFTKALPAPAFIRHRMTLMGPQT